MLALSVVLGRSPVRDAHRGDVPKSCMARRVGLWGGIPLGPPAAFWASGER